MKLTADHENRKVTIEIPLGGPDHTMVVSLSVNDVGSLASYVDREFHFREDLMTELERMVDSGKYAEGILSDSSLVEAILDDYFENRQEHGSGSGSEDIWPWTDSLREALNQHREEILQKYAKEEDK